MGKHYSHFSSEERVMIQLEIDNGASMRSVARPLGRRLHQRSLQPLGGRHPGGAQDPLCCSVPDNGCTAEDALQGFTRQMKKLPAFLRESLTYDRGREMACHKALSERLKLDVWFADPHAPWQRGSNENTNGLLRQFMPKGIDLSDLSQTQQLNDMARLLNGRPRKALDGRTPEEAMNEEMAKYSKRVALAS